MGISGKYSLNTLYSTSSPIGVLVACAEIASIVSGSIPSNALSSANLAPHPSVAGLVKSIASLAQPTGYNFAYTFESYCCTLSFDCKTKIPAPSPITNPSRFSSKGQL